jgi:arylsulfatase A-like enzyme
MKSQTVNRRAFLSLAGAAAVGTAAVPRAWTQGSKQSGDRPNILIIMTDQQFADAMSCAIGNEYINTPAMDSLAANGMRFTRAYAANPICCPSRSAMFTGRYPHETGVQNNSGAVDVEKFPILGKVFKDAGYDTGYTGKVHIYLDYEDRKKAKFSEKTADIHGFDPLSSHRERMFL